MGGIINAVEFKTESGGVIFLRKMSGIGRARYYETIEDSKQYPSSIANARITASLIIISLVNKEGKYIYTHDEIEDVMELDSDYLDEIAEQVLEVNGLSESAAKKAKKK